MAIGTEPVALIGRRAVLTEVFRFQPAFLILRGLRCLGMVGDDVLARATGMSREKVVELLRRLHRRGLVQFEPAPFGGWSLTPAGLATDYELTTHELDESGARDGLYRCYRSFLRLDEGLREVGQDWELRPLGGTRVLNNHSDEGYDAEVLARLVRIDDAAQWIYAELADLLERFGIYRPRFSFALEHALAGGKRYVTGHVDAYQSVWLQLHEDLATTLGISDEEQHRGLAG